MPDGVINTYIGECVPNAEPPRPISDGAFYSICLAGGLLAGYLIFLRPRQLKASEAEIKRYGKLACGAGAKWPFREFTYDENVDAFYGVDARGDSFKVYSDGTVKR
jgi:hypothetical protein